MICEIVTDVHFLAVPSTKATMADLPVAKDLQDTLTANAHRCVGLAANMIGVQKAIIIVEDEGVQRVLFNPEILQSKGAFQTEEGCLSLVGTRPTKRYQAIKLRYENEDFQIRTKTFTGFTAQIIQHEIDHCNGIII